MKKSGKSLSLITVNILLIGIIIGMGAAFLLSGEKQSVEAGKIDLENMQYTFRAVAEDVLPSVVEIMTVEVRIQEMPEGYSWPFNFITPEDSDDEVESQEFETEGLGSGVIVRKKDNQYWVLTNNHVIGNADRVSVRLFDKDIIDAEITGLDERKDLALISFYSEKELPIAKMGDSDSLYVGDWVLAVGSPLGYESTVTAGIVSAIGRSGPENNISDFIQTDASINQGNSGGALVNLDGEVVGINTWIATTTGVSIGLGFSIPVNNVKKAIDDFISDGSVQYGWLGVTISDPDFMTEEQMALSEYTGAFVHNVYKDSPAGKAGLQPGDYVIQVNDKEILDYKQFTRAVGDIKAGDIITLKVVRNTKIIEIKALIELRKEKDELINLYNEIWPGFTALPMDEQIKKEFSIPESLKGVIISVDTGTGAFDAGLRNFDIITSVNGNEINNMLDFYNSINDKSSNYVLRIVRNNLEEEIVLKK
ncbi:MAG: Do family serine endopeptidase [Spirochaetales bacterium]|uniref:Do family serine endopeptidase n=1 Tax=Candidatus Thalassospirochaeta sargassi TaxID=3119039 RepID=A0AAJ1IJ88_9SPIO|nr:Do family serine endopeptidase [Spirochaetales bacterium]